MLLALLAAGVLTVISPAPSNNATPLHLNGRTVALTAVHLGRGCISCRLVTRASFSAKAKASEPTPPPLVVPHDEDVTPPPLLDSDEQAKPLDELTPPPDAPAWQVPPERKLVPPPKPVDYDRNTGDWVGKEVAAGAAVLIVTDLVVGGAIFAVLLATISSSFGGGSSGDVVIGAFVVIALSLAHAALSPLWAAIAVKAIADEPTANGLGGAALGAYVSAIGLGALSFGVLIAISLVESASGVSTGTSFASSFGSLLVLVGVLARWIGVPIAASWAMHRGAKPSAYSALPPHPRKPIVINAFGREERPLGGATVLRF